MADDPIAEAKRLVRGMKGAISRVKGFIHAVEGKDDADFLERTRTKLERLLSVTPTAVAPKVQNGTRIRPCWEAANRVYEWGIKKLPLRQHNYQAIYEAALRDGPNVRLPEHAAAFAHFVRQYRKAKGLRSHREMRRAGGE